MKRDDIIDGYNKAKAHKHSKESIVVDFTPSAAAKIAALGYIIGEHIKNTTYTVVHIPPKGSSVDKAVDEVAGIEGINGICLDFFCDIEPSFNDPGFASQKSMSALMDADGLWDLFDGYEGSLYPNIIAQIDSGYMPDHPDVVGQYLLPGLNAGTMGGDIVGGTHGLQCSAIMAAAVNNGIGIAGLATNSKCWPIMFGAGPQSTGLARALNACLDRGVRVVSMSHYAQANDMVAQIVEHAYNNGLLFFASAGNTSQVPDGNRITTLKGCFGISGLQAQWVGGAHTTTNRVSNSSSYFEGTDFCAPFTVPTVSVEGDMTGFTLLAGTSASCPYAASLPAHMHAINPTLTARDMVEIMAMNCIPEIPPQGLQQYGYGIPQFKKTIEYVMDNPPSGLYSHLGPIRHAKHDNKHITGIYQAVSSFSAEEVWRPVPEFVRVRYFQVRFMRDGEEVAERQNLKEGSLVSRPDENAWYKDPHFESPWEFFIDRVTSNTTLYAHQ